MDKNKTAVEEFLGDLGQKNETNPFDENPENPFEQKEVIKEEPKEGEKPLPFNKDPKVQKFIEKEISKRLADYKPEPTREEIKDEVDDYYARLIGNDTPEKVAMIKEAQARDERMLQQAEERAFNRLSQREQEAIQADQAAEQELADAFDNIEETYGIDISSNNPIAVKTRQEFASFVEKIAPKDRNGDVIDYPDMQSAWETFSEIKKANTVPSRAKELANRSMTRSAETKPELQSKPTWDAADAFIDSLGKN